MDSLKFNTNNNEMMIGDNKISIEGYNQSEGQGKEKGHRIIIEGKINDVVVELISIRGDKTENNKDQKEINKYKTRFSREVVFTENNEKIKVNIGSVAKHLGLTRKEVVDLAREGETFSNLLKAGFTNRELAQKILTKNAFAELKKLSPGDTEKYAQYLNQLDDKTKIKFLKKQLAKAVTGFKPDENIKIQPDFGERNQPRTCIGKFIQNLEENKKENDPLYKELKYNFSGDGVMILEPNEIVACLKKGHY